MTLGPQPSEVQCCPSCQIIARAVARLAYALGYTETGDEITELMAEEDGARFKCWRGDEDCAFDEGGACTAGTIET